MNAARLLPLAGTVLIAGWLFAGCASHPAADAGVVVSQSTTITNKLPRPSVIYVSDFYLDPAEVSEAQGVIESRTGVGSRVHRRVEGIRGKDPVSRAQKLIGVLSDTIVKELEDAGQRAERLPNRAGFRKEFYPADVTLLAEGWLLGGWFVRVVENKPAVEAAVGFGHGGGDVETQVVVFDLARDPRNPFLFLGTESGQKHTPGGLVAMNPYAMGAKFVVARGATEKDVRKQGVAIVRHLLDCLQPDSK